MLSRCAWLFRVPYRRLAVFCVIVGPCLLEQLVELKPKTHGKQDLAPAPGATRAAQRSLACYLLATCYRYRYHLERVG